MRTTTIAAICLLSLCALLGCEESTVAPDTGGSAGDGGSGGAGPATDAFMGFADGRFMRYEREGGSELWGILIKKEAVNRFNRDAWHLIWKGGVGDDPASGFVRRDDYYATEGDSVLLLGHDFNNGQQITYDPPVTLLKIKRGATASVDKDSVRATVSKITRTLDGGETREDEEHETTVLPADEDVATTAGSFKARRFVHSAGPSIETYYLVPETGYAIIQDRDNNKLVLESVK